MLHRRTAEVKVHATERDMSADRVPGQKSLKPPCHIPLPFLNAIDPFRCGVVDFSKQITLGENEEDRQARDVASPAPALLESARIR